MRVQLSAFLCASLILLAGCSGAVTPAPPPTQVPVPTAIPVPTQTPTAVSRLAVSMLYPKADTEVKMGQSVKFIGRVTDVQGNPASGAQVDITARDAGGASIGTVPAVADAGGIFRSEALPIPHRMMEGPSSVSVVASAGAAEGSTSANFKIVNSTSEILLHKYGFWLDAPALKGIDPQIAAERGDAHNGLIRWGGILPAQHVLPAVWVEIQWREGNHKLDSPEAVRRFMLDDLGDLGFTPIRDLGPFEPFRFKQWDGWRVGARGQFHYDDIQWVVFYAPEVDKTYGLSTHVVLPPAGSDPHAALLASFAVFPDVHAAGVAPEPLARLLPGPELTSPPLGTRFAGLSQAPVLRWKPVKELASDEYYEVAVDWNYRESNPTAKFTTRQTELTLPETLYRTPNCGVFNWQVTLMRQTGVDANGQPTGEPVSYNSLYWYLWWSYPPGGQAPFVITCPNAQF